MLDAVWLIIIIILIVIEIISLNLTSSMFIISAIIAINMNKNEYSFLLQVIEFILVGVLLTILLKPLLLKGYKKLKKRIVKKK